MRRIAAVTAAVTAAALMAMAGLAVAETLAGAAAAKNREDRMEALQKSIEAIAAFAKGEGEQAGAAAALPVLEAMGKDMAGLWPADSGPAAGVETWTKPELWTDAATFEKVSAEFTAAVPAVIAAVQAGDAAATGAALQTLGGTCRSCHQPFRIRKP